MGKTVAVIAGLAVAIILFAITLQFSPAKTHPAERLVATIRTAVLTGDGAGAEVAYERLKGVGPAAVPFASELLRDRDAKVRAAGAELVQELVEEIRERNADGYTPMEVREAIPLLVSLLEEGDDDVRQEAASTLGWIGRDAGVTIPTLQQALDDPSNDVRETAARALDRIQAR